MLQKVLKEASPRNAGSLIATLERGYVRCLQPLRAFGHFKFHRLPVGQGFVPLRLNRGKMDEHVLAGLALNESKSLAGIEPLHCSLFFQLCISFLFELLVAISHCLQPKNKGCKCGLAAPLTNSKGFTRATNAGPWSHAV